MKQSYCSLHDGTQYVLSKYLYIDLNGNSPYKILFISIYNRRSCNCCKYLLCSLTELHMFNRSLLFIIVLLVSRFPVFSVNASTPSSFQTSHYLKLTNLRALQILHITTSQNMPGNHHIMLSGLMMQ